MLLQTNSYIVPPDKRAEHARVVGRFRQVLRRLGCDHFEVYEQVGANWSNAEAGGRYVQILRFVDRKHQLSVQSAERSDPVAQQVIADFCDLINFPYQQQQGLFAVGFYTGVLPTLTARADQTEADAAEVEHEPTQEPPDESIEEPASAPVDPLTGGAAVFVAEEAATELVDEPAVHPASEHLFADEPVGQSVTRVAESAEQIGPETTPSEESTDGFTLPPETHDGHAAPGHTLEDLAGLPSSEPVDEFRLPPIESFEVGTGLEGEMDIDDEVPHMPVPPEPEPATPSYMRLANDEDDVLTDEHEVHGFVEEELVDRDYHDKPHTDRH